MKKSIKIVLAVIFLLVCICLVMLGRYFLKGHKHSKTSTLLYTINYEENNFFDANHIIKIYDDKVEIETKQTCPTTSGCNPESSKSFEYSQDRIEKLKKFYSDNFTGESLTISKNELTDRQAEIMQGILIGQYFFEIYYEDYEYKLAYMESDNIEYVVYFKNNNTILVKKETINNDYQITNIDTYELEFSDKNKDILLKYVMGNLENDDDVVLYKYATLRKDEKNIFESIVKNDESYLNNYETDVKLSYTITYNGIYCETPVLYLYNDNTYEYYNTFNSSDKPLKPKTGTYDYDINKIINNIDKYDENPAGPYYIEDFNKKSYVTYNSNVELMSFLKAIDISLEMCLEQEF